MEKTKQVQLETVYDTNGTMKMIGQQYYISVLLENLAAIDEIAQARPYSFTKEAAMDIFILGYISGKRAERAWKKENRKGQKGK